MPKGYERLRLPLAAVLLWLVSASCNFGNEGIFSVGGLQVVPDPAQPGDTVMFSFNLVIVPERNYTVRASIDGIVKVTETFQRIHDGPVDVVMGTADDLIAEFGLGTHAADVEILLNETNDLIGARTVSFELQETPPPASIPAVVGLGHGAG